MPAKRPPKENFKDLYIHCNKKQIGELRSILAAICAAPWRHAPEKESEAAQFMVDGETVIFERASFDGIESAGFFMAEHPVGLKVINIVPIQSGELGTAKYNQILEDFEERIIRASQLPKGCWVETMPIGTKPDKKLDIWK